MSGKPQDGLAARSRYAETRDNVPSRWFPSVDLSLAPYVLLTPHVWRCLRVVCYEAEWARVSKIDVDALLDKNKLLAEGCDRFSHVRRRRPSRGDLREFWFLRSEKEAARLLQIRMAQVPVP